MSSLFNTRVPNISDNQSIRTPQREAYEHICQFSSSEEREASIILPVGCGKSGTIALSPFAFKSYRTLVVAPNLHIAKQLHNTFDVARDDMFYRIRHVLAGGPWPELVEIRGTKVNRSDLEEADIIVTNIHQLQGGENRWLNSLPTDFFDLILFDEGHHNVAQSWDTLKAAFPRARVLNFSATPMRADGQLMAGRVIYSYPVARAIREGFVKRLKAVVLNPRTLSYVRRDGEKEIEVNLEEVRRLGEDDADFRRSIVTSTETLSTIVSASVRELNRLRQEANDSTLKIIASALNYEHCHQIVKAYRARGCRADFVHSREDGKANERVLRNLENDELDVIVQVRKLGEGFDHPKLAVAAVFSLFSNLSPFVQFVGRIMRVIKQNAPNDPINRGVVVFHAGANCARRWEDFQVYTEADQEFFDELLPMEGVDFRSGDEIEIEPVPRDESEGVEVRSQSDVHLEEIPLIDEDEEALTLIQQLRERGYGSEDVAGAMRRLETVDVSKVRQRQSSRAALDARVKTETGRILGKRGLQNQRYDLDRQRLRRSNFVVIKSAIDRQINAFLNAGPGERSELSQQQLDEVSANFDSIVERAIEEVFGG